MKIVYGTEGCSKCMKVKKDLEEAGEDFKYFDASEMSTEEMQLVVDKAGTLSLPIVLEE